MIGGIGARLLGSPLLTDDLDICASTEPANLERLAAALNELAADYRVAGRVEGFPAPTGWDACCFGGHLASSLTLVTNHGPLDVWFRPDGTEGYPDLLRGAETVELRALGIKVARLDDIIRSKEASGRDKDLAALPILRELRRSRAGRGNDAVRAKPRRRPGSLG